MNRVPGSAECAGTFAKPGANHFDAETAGTPLKLIEKFSQRLEQQRSSPANAAANHDDFRIKCIDQSGYAGGQRPDCGQPDPTRARITTSGGGSKRARTVKVSAAARPHRAIADGILKTAWRPHQVLDPAGIERDVTEMPRTAKVTVQ